MEAIKKLCIKCTPIVKTDTWLDTIKASVEREKIQFGFGLPKQWAQPEFNSAPIMGLQSLKNAPNLVDKSKVGVYPSLNPNRPNLGQAMTKNGVGIGHNPTPHGIPVEVFTKKVNIFGFPVTAILRWCGSDAWSRKDCRKMLDALNLKRISDITINCQLRAGAGAGGAYKAFGKPAKLLDKQKEALYSLIETPKLKKKGKVKNGKVKK
jgi:hypothetical protein